MTQETNVTQGERLRLRVVELRRAVYSRSGTDSPFVDGIDPFTGDRVHLRQNELDLLRAEWDVVALDSAPSEQSEQSERSEQSVVGAAPREASPPEQFTDPSDEDEGEASTSRRWIPAVAVLAVVVIGVGAFGFGRTFGSAPAIGSTPDAVPTIIATPHRFSFLEIFDGTQQPFDIPPMELGENVDPQSTRSLGDQDPETARVFVARTKPGLICLAVVLPNATSTITCGTVQRFSTEGLRLHMTTEQIVPKTGVDGVDENAFYECYWAPDGSLSVSSNTYRFPAFPHV